MANMNFTNPTPGVTPGIESADNYAQEIHDALEVIRDHLHTGNGDGAQLPASALAIDGDLSFNEHNLDDVRAVRLTDQSAVLVGVGDASCLYSKDGDLYFNDGAGAVCRITIGTNLNVTTGNTIYATQAVAGNHTILSTDTYVYLLISTAAARTITLPSANAVGAGRYYILADITGSGATNAITINRAGSDLIDGATSFVMRSNFGSLTIVSDGSASWHVNSNFNASVGNIALGTAPARSGAISLSNNTAIKFRDASNATDYNMIASDTSNNIGIGSESAPSVAIAASDELTMLIGPFPVLSFDQQDIQVGNLSINDSITLTAISEIILDSLDVVSLGQLFMGASATALTGTINLSKTGSLKFRNTLDNADLNGISCDGYNAITVGDTVNTGLALRSASAGSISNVIGSTTVLGLSSSLITIANGMTVQFVSAATAPTIKQADKTTNSGTGAPFVIQAQNETGTSSVGGALTLKSGSGTTSNGVISLSAGANTVFVSNGLDVQLGYATSGANLIFGSSTGSIQIGDGADSTDLTISCDQELALEANNEISLTLNGHLMFDTTGTSTQIAYNNTVNLITGNGDASIEIGAAASTTDITMACSSNMILSAATDITLLAASAQKFKCNSTGIGFFTSPPVAQSSAYTVTNPTTDRALNVTGDNLAQVAQVLGTLIADLKLLGLIGS